MAIRVMEWWKSTLGVHAIQTRRVPAPVDILDTAPCLGHRISFCVRVSGTVLPFHADTSQLSATYFCRRQRIHAIILRGCLFVTSRVKTMSGPVLGAVVSAWSRSSPVSRRWSGLEDADLTITCGASIE